MEIVINDQPKDEEQKRFDLKLSDIKKSNPKLSLKYDSLLFEEKIRLAKENDGKPVSVDLDLKKKIFYRANSIIETGLDPLEMEKKWDGATSKDDRPPIGGAVDD